MVNRGTEKPYVKCIGASATGVTQSSYLVRFKKYAMLLDCGMYQEGDIATAYVTNRNFLKKIKITDIDYIILSHVHIDHSGLIPALYAKGCQAHCYVPCGSLPYLKLLWEDSMKIMQQDCIKLNNKGTKASPFYTQKDIDRALSRCIEIRNFTPHSVNPDITLCYYPSGHIIYAQQIWLSLKMGYVEKRLGFTGDIGSKNVQPYVENRFSLPYVDLLIGENTYNTQTRENKNYDKEKDLQKIESVIRDSHRTLIPCFSLGRTQTILTVLYQMWKAGRISDDVKIIVDAPLAQKICNIWPQVLQWPDIMDWGNIHWVEEWTESQLLQRDNEPYVIISSSGFLNGGRIVEWLKHILPNAKNTILFCGYSGSNGTAYQIRYGDKIIEVDGMEVENNANIVELLSFSSHASYSDLINYYIEECRFNKLAVVHGDMKYKPAFCNTVQQSLVDQGKSARVICTNEDTKIYF